MKRLLFISLGIFFAGSLLLPLLAHAQAAQTGTCEAALGKNPPKIRVSIPIPQVTETVECTDSSGKTKTIYLAKDIGDYLAKFYTFFVGIVGILATVMVMYGGIRWILAAGNASRISGAKEVITSAIIGVVIAFSSYLLLFLLNPRLVNYDLLSTTMSKINITNVAGAASDLRCSSLPQGTLLELVTRGNESLMGGGWKTPSGTSVTSSVALCGDLFVTTQKQDPGIKQPGGVQCVGDVCSLGGGNSVYGSCFVDIGRCISGFIAGRIEWDGSANVDNVYLEAVCNDNKRVYNSDIKATITPDGHTYYFGSFDSDVNNNLQSKIALLRAGCGNSLKGYYLNIEVNDDQDGLLGVVSQIGGTTDDNYAVGKNGEPLSLESPDKTWPPEFSKINLLKPEDISNTVGGLTSMNITPYRIDLNITRNRFPAR